MFSASTVHAQIDEIDYPVEKKLGQGKQHEKRLRELIMLLEVALDDRNDLIVL